MEKKPDAEVKQFIYLYYIFLVFETKFI
jgi:hypothetical protein